MLCIAMLPFLSGRKVVLMLCHALSHSVPLELHYLFGGSWYLVVSE